MPDREAVILEDITGEGVLAELHPIQFKEDRVIEAQFVNVT